MENWIFTMVMALLTKCNIGEMSQGLECVCRGGIIIHDHGFHWERRGEKTLKVEKQWSPQERMVSLNGAESG